MLPLQYLLLPLPTMLQLPSCFLLRLKPPKNLKKSQLDFRPLLLLIMMGASASFVTSTGYQTNLMVYGPGGCE